MFIKYQEKLVLAIAFCLVFLIAFGMGRLSVIVKNIEPLEIIGETKGKEEKEDFTAMFVGSRNSDKYHFPDCYWATRIKPENQIWFKSEEEARKMGYTSSKCVKDRN